MGENGSHLGHFSAAHRYLYRSGQESLATGRNIRRCAALRISPMAQVTIKVMVKRFPNGALAVDNLNLAVADGEFLVLLGPSGCGKTTTLRSVAGLEHQTSGDIFIGDRLVNDLPPGLRDIAFVFQFYALYPHLTAYDNIAFPLRATRMKATEVDSRVREVASTLRIEHALKRRPNQLSSGEQQRLAHGAALVARPHVFRM